MRYDITQIWSVMGGGHPHTIARDSGIHLAYDDPADRLGIRFSGIGNGDELEGWPWLMVDRNAEKLSCGSFRSSTGLMAWILKTCDHVAGISPTIVSTGHDMDMPAIYWKLERSGRHSEPRTRT
ncbi:hypothetical protein J4E85_000867 [Alternaria conjuncta]|uniref:uncharacterized protein n=1 Tax=Alternaria conjuncta TaxID=181017 RepID=UPI0022201206|nr:uncharacterized protein J4E85_000867 [Alternaria conjuncta]KAI4938427.1 hypothetical protein J4E85_000867 [Alternaria conjuncta]